VIVSSADNGISWSRLAILPQRVLLLTAQDSGLIAHPALLPIALLRWKHHGTGQYPDAFRAASAGRSGDAVWIYATGQDGKVYLSRDSGRHFESVTPGLQQTAGQFEAIATSERYQRWRMSASAAFNTARQGELVQRYRQDNRRRPNVEDRLQGIEPTRRQLQGLGRAARPTERHINLVRRT